VARLIDAADNMSHCSSRFSARFRQYDQHVSRKLVTPNDSVGDAAGDGTVPTIVPETRQNSAPRADASQLARSVKWKRVKDLRGKTAMAEMLIGV
jgi:hypothetical protein